MNERMPMPPDEDLNAFLDDELDDKRRKEIEAAIALDGDLAARVAKIRLQDEHLRQLTEPILHEPVPERLRSIVQAAATKPKSVRQPPVKRVGFSLVWQFGAMAATLLLGVGLGWYANFKVTDERSLLAPYVQQAVLSHRLFEANKQFDPVESDSDVISIDASAKPFSVPARTPTLLGSNYLPVMVRKVEGARGDAIHIAYEDQGGNWTTLYIRQHSDDARLPAKFTQTEGQSVLYWLDGPLLYALVGTADEEKLRNLAEKIYESKAISEAKPPNQEQPFAPAVVR